MVEALRGLGYTTGTALADIIDNSIAAKASNVEIEFFWNGPRSWIAVRDDGTGMDEVQLDRAMRLGEQSPLDERSPDDLGRFGLGLKTASFSQCRRLTVASSKDGRARDCLRWDLDVLAASRDGAWDLLEGPDTRSEDILSSLSRSQSGTVVLWECLDRIVTAGFDEQSYLDLIDRVEAHLALTFHRFIEGTKPRLVLSINRKRVQPRDPFLFNHPATQPRQIERLPVTGGTVEVQGFVLPHKDRLDAQEFQNAAGPDGWTAHQGFYVYRNERLLLPGSWLGLGQGRPWTREEAYRLARIRLDIPNTADAEWKIDIRKSSARPPALLRSRLTRLAEDIRDRARKVFAHRGRATPTTRGELIQAWRAEHSADGVRYRIDLNHPAIKVVLEAAGPLSSEVNAMLRIIEETIPVQRIWLDTAEAKDTPRTGFSGAATAEVSVVLEVTYRNLLQRKGLSPTLAREQLLRTEPFQNYPELIAALPDTLDQP